MHCSPSSRHSRRRSVGLVLLFAMMMIPSTGCVGAIANLLYVSLGQKDPARYDGLTKHRVAVVCVSKSSLLDPSSASEEIAQRVEHLLVTHVPKIEIIDQQIISDWIEREEWDEIDYREVGQGVDAQMVIGIDIVGFSLYDGNTLYQGRADVALTVFDMDQGGKVVFKEVLPQIQSPVLHPLPTTDMAESKFRELFLQVVVEQIANTFYDHDRVDQYARDSGLLYMSSQ